MLTPISEDYFNYVNNYDLNLPQRINIYPDYSINLLFDVLNNYPIAVGNHYRSLVDIFPFTLKSVLNKHAPFYNTSNLKNMNLFDLNKFNLQQSDTVHNFFC